MSYQAGKSRSLLLAKHRCAQTTYTDIIHPQNETFIRGKFLKGSLGNNTEDEAAWTKSRGTGSGAGNTVANPGAGKTTKQAQGHCS